MPVDFARGNYIMPNVDPFDLKRVDNNIIDIIKKLQAKVDSLARRNITVNTLNEISSELGQVVIVENSIVFSNQFETTATAAGTTTLTVTNANIQEFTGVTTQTIVLPDVTTLTIGQQYTIINNSSGALTINSSGGNLVQTIAAGYNAIITCILLTGTSAASWDSIYIAGSGTSVADIGSTAETLGGAVANGSAATASRSDHKHAITNPAIDTLAAATDITTLNASTSAHGLVVKATAPASGLYNYVGITNAETAYTNKALFDASNPANVGTVATGSAAVAARRDHVHAATEGSITTTDVTTGDASTTKHGFLLKATAPAANELNVVGIANGETVYANKDLFNTTNPVALGVAAAGTGIQASRSDHVHLLPTPQTVGATQNSGWTETSDAWSYASASTITIPSDGTTTYQKSMKIRLKQGGGYKYYVVASLTATVITVIVNTDYTVANSAITNIAYSFAEMPYGWPDFFAYAPSVAGLTVGNATVAYRYKITGNITTVETSIVFGSTTSVSGDTTIATPTTPASAQLVMGSASLYDLSGSVNVGITLVTGTSIYVRAILATGSYAVNNSISSTIPFTWTTGDTIMFICSYKW
jgi:hypothetical protein